MQDATPNVAKLLSKWVLLKCDLILIRRICGLIHNSSHSTDLFATTFCLSSHCIEKILVHIYLFDPNYRTVVVTSIQILLAQRISSLLSLRPCTVHY